MLFATVTYVMKACKENGKQSMIEVISLSHPNYIPYTSQIYPNHIYQIYPEQLFVYISAMPLFKEWIQ